MKTGILILPLLVLASVGFAADRSQAFFFHLDASSTLYLEGSSNVSNFSCVWRQDKPLGAFVFSPNSQGDSLHFSGAGIDIEIRTLDCGNQRMNHDLYQTLNASLFPHIDIALHEATLMNIGDHEYSTYKTLVDITMNNHKLKTGVELDVQSMGESTWSFRGRKKLKMSDFNVDPPTAMLGLVRVKDEITIVFDLVVHIAPQKENAGSIPRE